MATKTKSWAEKYNTRTKPEIKKIDKAFADIPEGATMLIATPQIIEDYIKSIPQGKTVDIKTIRKDLAIEYNAEYTCPVTTGIFLRIVAEANYEKLKNDKNIAPFWRVINGKSPVAKKLTFGTDFIFEQRNKENIR